MWKALLPYMLFPIGFAIMFGIVACSSEPYKPVTFCDNLSVNLLSKNSPDAPVILEKMSKNLMYFRSGKRCFATLVSKTTHGYSVVAITQVDCQDFQ